MNPYFEGWYFKNQNDGRTFCLIPGRESGTAFIQVITNDQSFYLEYPLSAYRKGQGVAVGKSLFTQHGIRLSIQRPEFSLHGVLRHKNLTPIQYDIMGPFALLPMQCRHQVISMNHTLWGNLVLNGETLTFSGGKGYIEGDRGRSFPKSYTWVHCNDFPAECSIMLSIAQIPLGGRYFWGCICVVWYGGREYRLATYKGVKILSRERERVEVAQGRYRLVIEVEPGGGHPLKAPQNGQMLRSIHENTSTKARFCFYDASARLFDWESENTSYEFVE